MQNQGDSTNGFIFLNLALIWINNILDKIQIGHEIFYALIITIICTNIAKFIYYLSFKLSILEFFKVDLPSRFLIIICVLNTGFLSWVVPSLKFLLEYLLILVIFGEFLEILAVIYSLKTKKPFNFENINFYQILIDKIKEKIINYINANQAQKKE